MPTPAARIIGSLLLSTKKVQNYYNINTHVILATLLRAWEAFIEIHSFNYYDSVLFANERDALSSALFASPSTKFHILIFFYTLVI